VTLLGWAVGGIAADVLADYIGRKRMLMLSISVVCRFRRADRAFPRLLVPSDLPFLYWDRFRC
jgi:MFS family permease